MALYSKVLILHSYFRWVVVLVLLSQLVWLWYHSRRRSIFTVQHFLLLNYSMLIYYLQFLIGWLLYFESPLAQQFWADPDTMVKVRDIRFFGLEHSTMMTLAIPALHILFWRSVSYIGRDMGFSKILRWFVWVIIIILVSIPWSFSPFTHRPLLR